MMGMNDILLYLESLDRTVGVIDVRGNQYFKDKGIDLVYLYITKKGMATMTICINEDLDSKNSRYVFETDYRVKEVKQNSFLFSEADFYFYYFEKNRELNMIPLSKAKASFIAQMSKFKDAETKAVVNGQILSLIGREVPKIAFNKELNITSRLLNRIVPDNQTNLGV